MAFQTGQYFVVDATGAQVDLATALTAVGVPDPASETFDPGTAGAFFSFSFCAVVLLWLVAHCGKQVLAPLLWR